MENVRNITSNAGNCEITRKEITIPLTDFIDLIAKETILDQIRYAVLQQKDDFGSFNILRAILQIDTPKDKK